MEPSLANEHYSDAKPLGPSVWCETGHLHALTRPLKYFHTDNKMENRIKPLEVQYESVPPLPSAFIWLCHPGYPDSLTPHVIARILCFDQDSSSTGEWGVHHGIFHTIALILSGNRPGKLVPLPQSSESSMSDNDSLTDDAILLGTQYYYFPSDWNMAEEGPYGIVKSFHDYWAGRNHTAEKRTG